MGDLPLQKLLELLSVRSSTAPMTLHLVTWGPKLKTNGLPSGKCLSAPSWSTKYRTTTLRGDTPAFPIFHSAVSTQNTILFPCHL